MIDLGLHELGPYFNLTSLWLFTTLHACYYRPTKACILKRLQKLKDSNWHKVVYFFIFQLETFLQGQALL